MITVHQENKLKFLQPREERFYPSDNSPCFEEWFLDNYDPSRNKGDRILLPILPTELNKRLRRDRYLKREVDHYFRALDKSKKYAIIVQHDDGIKFNTWGIDLKIFGMGCKGDVQLPLVCQPHKYEFKETGRPIFASFIGSITHPIREQMVKELQGKDGYFISTEHTSLHSYCYIMSQSVFTLAPLGYGFSSFRLCESVQYKSIPVYIANNPLLPTHFDIEKFCVLLRQEDNIVDKLKAISIEEIQQKRRNLENAFESYFSYQAIENTIYKSLNNE